MALIGSNCFSSFSLSSLLVIVSCCFLVVGQNLRVQKDNGLLLTTVPTELDIRELARQNKITQQILQNYLERRLFPHLNRTTRVPTVQEILPRQPLYNGAGVLNNRRQRHRMYNHQNHGIQDVLQLQLLDDTAKNAADEVESLQSVESEHITSFYANHYNDEDDFFDDEGM